MPLINCFTRVFQQLPKRLYICLFLVIYFTPIHVAAEGIDHTMRVWLDPHKGTLDVVDHITLPASIRSVQFHLNKGLELVGEHPWVKKMFTGSGRHSLYQFTLPAGSNGITLRYRGKPTFRGIKSLGQMPEGILSSKGAYLDGRSAWYPLTSLPVERLDLDIKIPDEWKALSNGGLREGRWQTRAPQDDLYLVAGTFSRYAKQHGEIDLSVWLLGEDQALADRYLSLMGGYIDHYSKLIGNYPFAKFAVVENPWQTGFGMPSFTLLGSRVLRLPFIPYTSLPHEILHNWLGNGIWVDYQRGNWSEGLTAYLADHWMKEKRGQGAQYRQKSLQRFSNFAADGRDSPLLQFISRHNDTSQAIGYDKSLMLFHMIRRELDNAGFVEALQSLWRHKQFKTIGFEEMLDTLLANHPDLLDKYRPWLATDDVPSIRLKDASVVKRDDLYWLKIQIECNNPEALQFDLPVAITTEAGEFAEMHSVTISASTHEITLPLESNPVRVDIDPRFDLLRRLDASEQAPALNQLFSTKTAVVIPAKSSPTARKAWRTFAQGLQKHYPELVILSDEESLPDGIQNRLLLGWENRLLNAAFDTLNTDEHRLDQDGMSVNGENYPAIQHTLVLVGNDRSGIATGFIGTHSLADLPLLARKLPHYGSFGRLVFSQGAENLRRDVLAPQHSVLSRQLGHSPAPLKLPKESVLGQSSD